MNATIVIADHLGTIEVTRDNKVALKLAPTIEKWHKRCGKNGFVYVSDREFYRYIWGNAPFNRKYFERNRSKFYTMIMENARAPLYIVPVSGKVKQLPDSLVDARRYIPIFRDVVGFVIVNDIDGWLYMADAEWHQLKLAGGADHRNRRNIAVQPLLSPEVKRTLSALPQLLLKK